MDTSRMFTRRLFLATTATALLTASSLPGRAAEPLRIGYLSPSFDLSDA